MRTLRLVESVDHRIALTEAEAAALRNLGRELASRTRWWGDEPESEEATARSVVRCQRLTDYDYLVRVADAVGVIGLGESQLIINPKIPLPHLLYLFGESDQFPRSVFEGSQLGPDASFFTVIATWFIEACEQLLRHGLVSDYGRITDDLACARGRIHTIATARSILVGRPAVRCDYDIRTEDTSLNRVVKAAALAILGSPAPETLRARCRRIHYRLSGVGSLRHGDTRARPDLLTRTYRDVHPLALLILNGSSFAMNEGIEATWTFLCRTPEAVEAGVREGLSRRLGSDWPIAKRGKALEGNMNRTLNPDLVFGRIAVGDIKYKVTTDGSIGRADLNQVTTFATGYDVTKAVVASFGSPEDGERVRVGQVQVTGFNWGTAEPIPAKAADQLAEQIEKWLNG